MLQMVRVKAQERPSAEDCLRHQWFEADRAAIEGSLLLNKNSKVLANIELRAQLAGEG